MKAITPSVVAEWPPQNSVRSVEKRSVSLCSYPLLQIEGIFACHESSVQVRKFRNGYAKFSNGYDRTRAYPLNFTTVSNRRSSHPRAFSYIRTSPIKAIPLSTRLSFVTPHDFLFCCASYDETIIDNE